LQDRFAAHRDHWLWQIGREFAHARAASGGEQDGFVDFHPFVMSSEVETSLAVNDAIMGIDKLEIPPLRSE